MKQYLTTNEEAVVYTAKKDETVTINFWHPIFKSIDEILGEETKVVLSVKSATKTYNDNDPVCGCDNEHPDTVHEIKLHAGESIYAWCSKENTVRFEMN